MGGGTHPGSGLPVIYSSARIASDLLLEDLEIDPRQLDQPPQAGGKIHGTEPASAV